MNSLQLCATLLLVLPWCLAFIIYFSNRFFRTSITLLSVLSLAAIALAAVLQDNADFQWSLPDIFAKGFLAIDFLILAYFAWVGVKNRNRKVGLFSFLQMILLVGVILAIPHSSVPDLRVDRLTLMMYLLINGVGGVVAFFALRYMQDEPTTESRRSAFVAILVAFIGVMNFVVSANNLEWFFLGFEATTLASFVLIGFRQDDLSRKNAQTALWMNQIGGVAILVALTLLALNQNVIHLSALSGMAGILPLLPVALLILAALVKGAQLPFSGWLLGAMVAPTPVSAILHSSTMVKIAPYLLLRLAPLMQGTWLSFAVILLTGAVYVFAGMMALDETNFKRILAWSTVALLGLMMMTAAIGTPQAMTAAITLMLFHGVSKALLFMQAGVMEKSFHKKNIEEFAQLIRYAPITTFFINVGFLSIALPPFGAFIGKWLGLATATGGMSLTRLILPILFMSFGSVVLSILYFRVVGILSMKKDAHYRSISGRSIQLEKLPFIYFLSGLGLFGVLAFGALFIAPLLTNVFAPIAHQLLGITSAVNWISTKNLSIELGFTTIYFWQIALAFSLVVMLPSMGYLFLLKNVDIVKEYACGEKVVSDFSMYSYMGARRAERFHRFIMTGLIVVVLLAGVIGR